MAQIYKHDYAAFGEEVLNAPWMVAEMKRRADAMKEFAESIAPYDAHTIQHYKELFVTEAHPGGGAHHDRAEGVLTNLDDPLVVLAVEYGNKNTPEHATMRKSLDAAK